LDPGTIGAQAPGDLDQAQAAIAWAGPGTASAAVSFEAVIDEDDDVTALVRRSICRDLLVVARPLRAGRPVGAAVLGP